MFACKKYAALLAPFAEEDLTGRDRERVAGHLARCAACRREAETLRVLASTLRTHKPAVPEVPAAFLWTRIEAEITASAAEQRVPERRRVALPFAAPRIRFAIRTTGMVAAACACGLLLVGKERAESQLRGINRIFVTLVTPVATDAPVAVAKTKNEKATVAVSSPVQQIERHEIASVADSRTVKQQRQAKTVADPFVPLSARPARQAQVRSGVSAKRLARQTRLASAGGAILVADGRFPKDDVASAKKTASATPSALSRFSGGAADLWSGPVRGGGSSGAPVTAPVPAAPAAADVAAVNEGEVASSAGAGNASYFVVRPDARETPVATATATATAAPAFIDASVGSRRLLPASVVPAREGPTANASVVDAAQRANRQRSLFSYGAH